MNLLGQALDRCHRAAKLCDGEILVGLSGGKDSLATLDLICRSGAFQRVEAFSMYLVKGLECFEAPIRKVSVRYGIPVHFVPHWDLFRMLKLGILRMHLPNPEKVKSMRLKDVELGLVQRTGVDFFAYGERATDSIARRLYTRECDGVQAQWRRLWPIWDWKTSNVVSYLKARKIPLPEAIGDKKTTSGLTLMPETLRMLKERHPDDYARILKVFPFADVQLKKPKPVKIPKIRNRKSSTQHASERPIQSTENYRFGEEETAGESEKSGVT